MNKCIKTSPIVYCIGDSYVIAVPVTRPTVMWVSVGDECYYDHSNGVLRSDVTVHRITVPSGELDKWGKYTVCLREVIERKPYFSNVSDVCEEEFAFSPVPRGRINVYHIADAHGDTVNTVDSAKCFERKVGKIDLLVLNGDIIDHSGNEENFGAIHEIAAQISGGNIPVLCVRGNHDLRGLCAEKLEAYIPTRSGNTYYTFRLGEIWGIVLDCAEDKNDDHPEYGNCNCCHAFRSEQTAFIESVINNAACEYAAEGVKYRIVIAHNPFTMKFVEPFNIEEPLYEKWVRLLNESIKPMLLLSGHKHCFEVVRPGEEEDGYGQSFPTVIGSIKDHKTGYFAGCGLVLDDGKINLIVTDGDKVVSTEEINI